MDVLVNFAMSINGSLGVLNQKTPLSNKLDWERVHAMRAKHDAILVGANTIRVDDPSLQVKKEYYPYSHTDPMRVIPSFSASFPEERKVFIDDFPTLLLLPKTKEPFHIPKKWKNVDVLFLENMSPEAIVTRLNSLGFSSLFVEGGAKIISSFLSSSIPLKLRIFVGSTFLPVTSSIFWGASRSSCTLESVKKLGDGYEAVYVLE